MPMRWKRGSLVGAVALMGLAGALWFSPALRAATEEPWKAPSRAARKQNPVASDDASIAAGKALYAANCLSCHGNQGTGNGPAAKDLEKSPGDLSKPALWEQTDGALFWKLTEGRTPMPTFEKTLSETERWQTINYIRTLAPKPASSSQPANDGGKQ